MVQIDLLRLRQQRTLTLAGSIGPDSELWTGSGLRFADAVEVRGNAALGVGGGIVVQGSWRAPLVYECGRCLDDLQVAVERSLTLLFVLDGSWEAPDPDVRIIDGRETVLDLQDAIREEIVLEAPRYYTAGEEDGRCTRCGSPVEEYRSEPRGADGGMDPRWAALKALQTDQEENDGRSQEAGFQAAEAEAPHSR
ncbi:MAG: DUF177 domain-containing protein [Gemmatimonadetes bacterium]|nr:DUF177 domain-containing protein [Gemmatimonadota bacterium]MYD12063.1 DUF177 domain-containing protein [Gemmatimonadota bacterium]MYI65108.1 DUF177 domain-containing protein [Gemmatimonadota bacterium]